MSQLLFWVNQEKENFPLPRLPISCENKLSSTSSIFYREQDVKYERISPYLPRIRAGYVFTKKSEMFLLVRSCRISVLRCIL